MDPNLSSAQRSTGEWFNTGDFVQPIYQFGTVGRNTMIGPGLSNIDATVARTFRIREKLKLQFRVEVFNLANHSNYNLVGRVINDPTFGIVQNQLPPRQIQLGLKAEFNLTSIRPAGAYIDSARQSVYGPRHGFRTGATSGLLIRSRFVRRRHCVGDIHAVAGYGHPARGVAAADRRAGKWPGTRRRGRSHGYHQSASLCVPKRKRCRRWAVRALYRPLRATL